MKYYAIKNTKEIVSSWEECQTKIALISNPQYKSFLTLAEARAYLDGVNPYDAEIKNYLARQIAVAFIDGSFNESNNFAGSGILFFWPNGTRTEFSFATKSAEFAESRNIVGETMAMLEVLKIAENKNIGHLAVYFDYLGLEKWYNKQWAAKSGIAVHYLEKLRNYRQIRVEFRKVKAHSNNEYNDIADRLAKEAAGL
jgi:ribonuclease HI